MQTEARRTRLLALVSAVITLLATPRALHGQDKYYVITEIMPADGSANTRAYGLNNYGQVVGDAPAGTEKPRAWHWQNGDWVDLNDTNHFRDLFTMQRGEAYGVSDGDQIVGGGWYTLKVPWREEPLEVMQAYVARPAVLSDFGTPLPGDAVTVLGAFGGLPPGSLTYDSSHELHSCATAISNANHVVGWANITDHTTVNGIDEYHYHNNFHAFLVHPTNSGDGYYQYGAKTLADGTVIYANTLMQDLGVLSGVDQVSSATDVNDNGWVVGYSYGPATGYLAFLIVPQAGVWATLDTHFVNSLMQPLGTLGGTNSWARSINNAGVAVGDADTDTLDTHAFRWEGGLISDLGTLGGANSAAMSINSAGTIVGWAETADRAKHACVWQDGEPIDLNARLILTRSWELVEARAINDSGQIIGWGQARSDSGEVTVQAFILNEATAAEIAASQPPDPNNPTGGGFGGGTGTIAPPLELEPIFYPFALRDPKVPTTTPTTTPTVTSFCGLGLVELMPLMIAGLVGMKYRRRRA
jgi:probable HAF family extracellular repeat protein